MSHHNQEIVCPNCGFKASHNYCAQCGQETHLHKDTFGALFMHFIGHYFHYDSKFLKTLRALWFSPAKLTHAYWNKQRARYISPISLYIFISAVFFACLFLVIPSDKHKTDAEYQQEVLDYKKDSTSYKIARSIDPELAKKIRKKTDDKEILAARKKNDSLAERFMHNMPKLFIFLLPVMAIMLRALYYKRKELTVVHHTIFALHTQAFFFTIFFFLIFLGIIDSPIADVAADIVSLMPVVYFIIAMKTTYKSGWLRSILYSIIVGVVCILVSFIFLAAFYIVLTRLKMV